MRYAIVFIALHLALLLKAQSSAEFEVLVIRSESNAVFCNAREVVGKRWNITYTPFLGCVAGSGLIDQLMEQNEGAFTRIAKRYGSNWQDRFDAELKQELKTLEVARRLADEHGFIKLRKAYIQRQGNGFSYAFTEEEEGVYRIRMFTGQDFFDRKEHREWSVLVVDMQSQKVRVSPPKDNSLGLR